MIAESQKRERHTLSLTHSHRERGEEEERVSTSTRRVVNGVEVPRRVAIERVLRDGHTEEKEKEREREEVCVRVWHFELTEVSFAKILTKFE